MTLCLSAHKAVTVAEGKTTGSSSSVKLFLAGVLVTATRNKGQRECARFLSEILVTQMFRYVSHTAVGMVESIPVRCCGLFTTEDASWEPFTTDPGKSYW